MIRYSVLIPQRNAGSELGRQLPELRRVLSLLALPYEVICIDRGSAPPTRAALGQLLHQHPFLRVLTLDSSAGLEAALAAGIAAARGELVVAIGPGTEYPLQQIPHLIAELSRTDIVFGVSDSSVGRTPGKSCSACHSDGCLARTHETPMVCVGRPGVKRWPDSNPARGTARFLPWLVAMRGFRVGETSVRYQPHARRSAIPGPTRATCWRFGGCVGAIDPPRSKNCASTWSTGQSRLGQTPAIGSMRRKAWPARNRRPPAG